MSCAHTEWLLITLRDNDVSWVNIELIFIKWRTVCTWTSRDPQSLNHPPNVCRTRCVCPVALHGDTQSVVRWCSRLCVKGQPCLLCSSQCCIGRLRVMSQVTLPCCRHWASFPAGASGCVPVLLYRCRLRAVELWCDVVAWVPKCTLLIHASVLPPFFLFLQQYVTFSCMENTEYQCRHFTQCFLCVSSNCNLCLSCLSCLHLCVNRISIIKLIYICIDRT